MLQIMSVYKYTNLKFYFILKIVNKNLTKFYLTPKSQSFAKLHYHDRMYRPIYIHYQLFDIASFNFIDCMELPQFQTNNTLFLS